MTTDDARRFWRLAHAIAKQTGTKIDESQGWLGAQNALIVDVMRMRTALLEGEWRNTDCDEQCRVCGDGMECASCGAEYAEGGTTNHKPLCIYRTIPRARASDDR